MKLAERLLLGALVLVSVLVISIVAIASGRLRERLDAATTDQLSREARLVASQWNSGVAPDSLADAAGLALGHRVTLSDAAGVIVGDSELDLSPLASVTDLATDGRISAVAATSLGTVIVSVGQERAEGIVGGARRDVLVAGFGGLVAAMLLAWLFSHSVSKPIIELSTVARAVAAGELDRRPRLAAPGEVGDLASALHRMAEQLAARVDALQQDDALMIALLDSLDEGVLAVNTRRDVVRVNSAGRLLLGIRDTPPFPVDRISRDPVLRAALDGALKGQSTDGGEVRVGDQTLLLTARPLARGGAVLALLDLTAIRKLETVRRDFVANVSHELKTPLTVISGFAETLADDDPPPAMRRQFVEAIRANALRMQRLVDDLLDLSRIETGGWTPKPVPVRLVELVREAAEGVAAAAHGKGVTVSTRIEPGLDTVHADPLAVRQVLSNLVENAVRHTHEGTVRIFAHRDGADVVLGVADTGTGIAPEHLPRIFERFYRADSGRARHAGGTGLGLAIVKHLVEAHGGRVHAESTLDVGTTVRARFPDAADATARRDSLVTR